ncbi:MAG: DUF3449 domain-containing protein, partial [Methanobacteriota archaeon]
ASSSGGGGSGGGAGVAAAAPPVPASTPAGVSTAAGSAAALDAPASHSASALRSAVIIPSVSAYVASAVPAATASIATDAAAASLVATAWLDSLLQVFTELLDNTLAATRARVEKRQIRTVEERLADYEAEVEDALHSGSTLPRAGAAGGGGGAEEEEEDEQPIYNPLNVPLGDDGKPIALWLFKLHGLNIKYECEICGGATYAGRRAFDRHFQERRHADSMRALGIPNTKHFHDITSIADAQALYAKLQAEVIAEQFTLDDGEEFEDSMGNVVNRKTYEDLARQGLL